MTHNVGISDLKVSNDPGDDIKTHSLGSCVGVTMYDPAVSVGGMLHYQLPSAREHSEKAATNPYMFGDTGITELMKEVFERGADKRRLVVKLAGGSNVADKNGFFNIGKRNLIIAKKFLWKNGLLITGEDVGGETWRNLKLELGSGRVSIKSGAGEFDI